MKNNETMKKSYESASFAPLNDLEAYDTRGGVVTAFIIPVGLTVVAGIFVGVWLIACHYTVGVNSKAKKR